MSDDTQILSQIDSDLPVTAEQLFPLIYEELRKLAAARLAKEKPGQTLQATALVHEVFLRLKSGSEQQQGNQGPRWDGRNHFFAAAAEAMRRILVEKSRRKKRLKHGGGLKCRQVSDALEAPEVHEDLVALDAALTRLAAVDPEAAKLVNLRYFAGLTVNEAAEVLGISPRTANRSWAFARAWLHQEIAGSENAAAIN
jgi:RNA polymerase sigma factor (TIGR02999 family)